MKKIIITILVFAYTNDSQAQTLVPYLLKNGNYRYIDSSTKIISSITGEMNGVPPLFSKNGNSIYLDAITRDIRIIDKTGKDIFLTRDGSREVWGKTDNVAFYTPTIIYDKSNGLEYILAETWDRRKRRSFEQYPGYRVFNKNNFSKYFKFKRWHERDEIQFSEGLTVASDVDEFFKKGYVNVIGEYIIPQIFDDARQFSEERGAVFSKDYNAWGFVDNSGKIVIPLKYSEVNDFKGGIALVTLKNSNVRIFIDKYDNKIMDFKGNYYSEYITDSLIANDPDNSTINHFYDNKGKLKLTVNYKVSRNNYKGDKMLGFDNGTLLVENNKRQIGLVNKKGAIIVPFGKYEIITSFREGIASVKDAKGYWGFIDNKGKEIVKPQYYQTHSFSDGLCAVKKLNGWGYINKNGNMVIEKVNFEFMNGKYTFDEINDFENGFSKLCKYGNCVFFDKTGYYYIEQ